MQPTGLRSAAIVLQFYLLGGVGDDEYNPFYTGPDSCPAKLVALLESGAYYSRNTRVIGALAKLTIKILNDAQHGTGGLASCVADIPAIVLALVSTSCPESQILYSPFDAIPSKRCKYEPVSHQVVGRFLL